VDTGLLVGILGIVGAILSAGAGVLLLIREIRRKERRDSLRQIKRLEDELIVVQDDNADCHTYSHQLRLMLIDKGLDPPDPPWSHDRVPDQRRRQDLARSEDRSGGHAGVHDGGDGGIPGGG
jgi:hypothetical protein